MVTLSKTYSQLLEKWPAFVRHFSGRRNVNAVAKITSPIDTWEFGSGILWGEERDLLYAASDVRLSKIYSFTPFNAEWVKFTPFYQSRVKYLSHDDIWEKIGYPSHAEIELNRWILLERFLLQCSVFKCSTISIDEDAWRYETRGDSSWGVSPNHGIFYRHEYLFSSSEKTKTFSVWSFA